MNQKEKLFCEFYSSFENATNAAINAGFKIDIAAKKAQKLLAKPEIKQQIEKLKIKFNGTQLVQLAINVVRHLIFGSANDAAILALKHEQLNEKQISKLNLFQVSEFKKLKDGSFEIKFIDRLKAIACLIEIAKCQNNSTNENEFLNALQNSCENKSNKVTDDL